MGLIEDSMVLDLGTALVEVNRTVINKLRPLKWRKFITPSTANSAAEFIEMRKRIDYADIKPIGPQDTKFPLAYEKKEAMRLPVFEFGAGIRIHYDEIERQTYMNEDSPVVTRAAAVARVAEELVDSIVAVGYEDLGMLGMLNQPDVPVVDSGDGIVAFDAATPAQMLANLNMVVDAIPEGTDEMEEATRLVVPPSVFRLASRTIFQSNSPDTVLQVFQRQNPGVAIDTWTHATDVVAGGRMLAWRGGDRDVFDFFMPRALTPTDVMRHFRHYEQGYYMKIGGVYSLNPLGAAYADDIITP